MQIYDPSMDAQIKALMQHAWDIAHYIACDVWGFDPKDRHNDGRIPFGQPINPAHEHTPLGCLTLQIGVRTPVFIGTPLGALFIDGHHHWDRDDDKMAEITKRLKLRAIICYGPPDRPEYSAEHYGPLYEIGQTLDGTPLRPVPKEALAGCRIKSGEGLPPFFDMDEGCYRNLIERLTPFEYQTLVQDEADRLDRLKWAAYDKWKGRA